MLVNSFINMGKCIVFVFVFTSFLGEVQAQEVNSNITSGVLQREHQRRSIEDIENRIYEEKELLDKNDGLKGFSDEKNKDNVYIKSVRVEGSVLLKESRIREIVKPYEGKYVLLKDIRRIVLQITEEYRLLGYVTSRAYIPRQELKDGILVLKVIEGKLGNLKVRGNKHFKTERLKKLLEISEDGAFDYLTLKQTIVRLNDHPDRNATMIIVPSKEQGKTDVIVDIKDRSPVHISLEYDNYASRYLEKDRFSIILEDNNFTGHDDRLFLKGQISNRESLVLQQLRYSTFVNRKLNIGFYALYSKTELRREYTRFMARGESVLYGIFAKYDFLKKRLVDVSFNVGFDYKDIENSLLGNQLSYDRLRIVKMGVDVDVRDRFGRNILTSEISAGIPSLLGGLREKDDLGSRSGNGTGGKFQKLVVNAFRLQAMPYHSNLLFKNTLQYSNYNLVSPEQFQIGGPKSVRGFGVSERSGDKGFYSAIEWSFPVYGLSRNIKVPYRENKLYDALRLVVFYDVGVVGLTRPSSEGKKTKTLRGYGFGVRLKVGNDITLRIEVALPMDERSADGDRVHTWVECQFKF